ncbi:hypothetical protein CVT24_008245 [Panaeolus cyanescens]|uniref:Sugar phosphate phosphatase n=1 Tax=Panaeolus cyanescens TaxID=181874 RepID=A0A409VF81_9AGAR|nr:hypothetical protein CVT24_008245 [Panaeolus cyanescens]
MTFKSSYPPYDPTDKKGFSYETVIKRWPIIITGVVDTLHKACHKLSLELQIEGQDEDKKAEILNKIEEGKAVIEKVSKLKYEMARDRALEPIPEDGEVHVEIYNTELEELKRDKRNTWFTAPWLYAEYNPFILNRWTDKLTDISTGAICEAGPLFDLVPILILLVRYRLLRSFLNQTTFWNTFDPFRDQKLETFRLSGKSILQIASTIHELGESAGLKEEPEKLAILFNEMIQMGNATDLSLLTHLSHDDIQKLQTVEKEARSARSKFILRDDEEPVWKHLEGQKDARIDFVLDNSGFELFTDLVFADFLVTYTPYVSKVVFHPKLIPWFVSDVTPTDFKETFELLSSPSKFFAPELISENANSVAHLEEMVGRWRKYLDQGVFSLSVPIDTPLGGNAPGSEKAAFWTTAKPYWDMETEGSEVFEDLKDSGLVVFKVLGDLNYRKLTGDVRWPAWTPFEEALGPLAGAFPLLSLRTNKADVIVGVDKAVSEEFDSSMGNKWRVDGR